MAIAVEMDSGGEVEPSLARHAEPTPRQPRNRVSNPGQDIVISGTARSIGVNTTESNEGRELVANHISSGHERRAHHNNSDAPQPSAAEPLTVQTDAQPAVLSARSTHGGSETPRDDTVPPARGRTTPIEFYTSHLVLSDKDKAAARGGVRPRSTGTAADECVCVCSCGAGAGPLRGRRRRANSRGKKRGGSRKRRRGKRRDRSRSQGDDASVASASVAGSDSSWSRSGSDSEATVASKASRAKDNGDTAVVVDRRKFVVPARWRKLLKLRKMPRNHHSMSPRQIGSLLLQAWSHGVSLWVAGLLPSSVHLDAVGAPSSHRCQHRNARTAVSGRGSGHVW